MIPRTPRAIRVLGLGLAMFLTTASSVFAQNEREIERAAQQMRRLMQQVRPGRDERLLDRLLVASVVEARGHERLGLVADALPEGRLKSFYVNITAAEGRHRPLRAGDGDDGRHAAGARGGRRAVRAGPRGRSCAADSDVGVSGGTRHASL